jgi:hypothetical protein
MTEQKWQERFEKNDSLEIDVQSITSLLVARFTADPDQTVTWRELSEHIGRNVDGSETAQKKARERLLRERRWLVEVNRGVGLYLAKNGGVVNHQAARLQKGRRNAKKLLRASMAFDSESATEVQRNQHMAYQSLAAAQVAIASHKHIKRVERAILEDPRVVPVGRTLDLFKKGEK